MLARFDAAPGAARAPARLAAGAGVLAAVVGGQLALAAALATAATPPEGRQEMRLALAAGARRVEYQTKGRVVFQPGMEDVRDLGPGGSLVLVEEQEGGARRLCVTKDAGGSLIYSYSEAGEVRAFGPGERAWFRTTLQGLIAPCAESSERF